jgi:hypothetical protein
VFSDGRRWREPNPKLYLEMKEILRAAWDELNEVWIRFSFELRKEDSYIESIRAARGNNRLKRNIHYSTVVF